MYRKKYLLAFTLLLPLTLCAQSSISLNSGKGGVIWKLKPQQEIGKDSNNMFATTYNSSNWVDAVVPGAVFTSYVNAGLEKDPNFGDNIYKVDKSKYNRNFWYRTTFKTPVPQTGEKTWLNFEGINRKGEVFFNGTRLGLLDGFMNRGRFDISALLSASGDNVLAVLVYWPTLPISNLASPTYISSDGWDWMPSVPGLLNGITDDVYLSTSGGVTITDPWIRTELPSLQQAEVGISMDLHNNTTTSADATITGTINPGNISFSQSVQLGAGSQKQVGFNSSKFRQLIISNPSLWWPNGYGDPNLYTCELKCTVNGKTSDSKTIQFGVKKYTYDTLGGVLHISINGERIFVKGGNWGMSEYMLRCRGEEYDLKVKLHREMNYNMIRNWIGSVTDEEFYAACDKYGIMVWDDFWLNSHPNLPTDVFAFNSNAVEKIKRLRNHPSIAVWCGDNEGYPLPPLNGWLREDVDTFDHGDRLYQPNSHSDALTGSGPWANFHPKWYFTKYPGGFGGNPGWGFRTEIGTAVFTNVESFKKFMPDSNWWPRNEMWNKHFFGKSAANGGPDTYYATIDQSYGAPTGIEDFCRKAQLLNIETNKALYEGWQHHMWNDASGVMTWMSQSAYPSFVWQTYDYYYDLTGAYWGVKKACEPVHIQWSYADNSVKVINTTREDHPGLQAEATVYNMDGKLQRSYTKAATVNAAKNGTADCFELNFSIDNLAAKKRSYASSGAVEASDANAATDGNTGSRWSSGYSDNEWIYVDLGEPKEISTISLNWEAAYAKAYLLQVSDDAKSWKEVYATRDGKGNVEEIKIEPVTARYVKMTGMQRATEYGYSLFELEVYGKTTSTLSPVHFIKLALKDNTGKIISDNFYWRNNRTADYTALNTLPKATLSVNQNVTRANGKCTIHATVTNPAKSKGIAFAVRVQVFNKKSGKEILPAIMNDNYFTLFKGESKDITIEFNEEEPGSNEYVIKAEAYNH